MIKTNWWKISWKNAVKEFKTKDKRRKAEWDLESAGLVLKIGHRCSSKFYRVYENDKR